MTGENRRQSGVFLFGAGASVDAGIPDTYRFVEDFQSHIKKEDSALHEQLLKILRIRAQFNERRLAKSQVDVEQLLDTLICLIDKNNDVLLDFYEKKAFDANARADEMTKIKDLLTKKGTMHSDYLLKELEAQILKIEKWRLKRIFDENKTFRFRFEDQ